MNLLECASQAEWRDWLQNHHTSENEIWLVFYKKESGRASLSYLDTLDEALCVGWIDSLIKKLDGARYARKFTPRRAGSQWSAVNKARVDFLQSAGRMQPAGLEVVAAAKASGDWDRVIERPQVNEIPPEFKAALDENPAALAAFTALPATGQHQYNLWIGTAKREDTRQRRIAEALELLAAGKRLGLR